MACTLIKTSLRRTIMMTYSLQPIHFIMSCVWFFKQGISSCLIVYSWTSMPFIVRVWWRKFLSMSTQNFNRWRTMQLVLLKNKLHSAPRVIPLQTSQFGLMQVPWSMNRAKSSAMTLQAEEKNPDSQQAYSSKSEWRAHKRFIVYWLSFWSSISPLFWPIFCLYVASW